MLQSIERDITGASSRELAELAAWIRLYKQHRALIHSGRVVRLEKPDDGVVLLPGPLRTGMAAGVSSAGLRHLA